MNLRQRVIMTFTGLAALVLAAVMGAGARWGVSPDFVVLSVVAAAVLGLAVILAYIATDRWLISPVEEIAADGAAASQGDLSVVISEDLQARDDEIGALARSFDRMLKSFKLAKQSTAPILEQEKKQLQKALAEREAILDAAQSGVLVVDKEGNVVTYNDRFVEIWQLSDEVLATGSDAEMMAEAMEQLEYPQKFYEHVQEVYETGEEDHTLIELSDGRIVERYGHPQMVGDERIGYVWTFRDITEQVARQDLLQQMNERFELANKATGEVIWDFDVEENTMWRSENYAAVYGYDQREEVFNAALDRIHPDDRNEVQESLREALDGDSDEWKQRYRYRTADGGYVTVRDQAIILRDDTGEAVRVVGAMEDISGQVAHEHELDERFEYAARATDTVVWDWDMETDILVRSENFYEEYGYDEDETADTWEACREEIHPDDRERVEQAIQEAIRSGESDWYLEYRYRMGDGSYVPVANQGYILRDDDGEAVRVIGSTRKLDEEPA